VIRIVLADDHALVREGLRRILEDHADLRVVAEATTGDEVLRAVAASPVDVVVLDISMPGPGVFELLKRLGEEHPSVRTVVLTMHPEDQYAVRVLRAGAAGYLSKDRSSGLLVEAIRTAHRGEVFVSPSLGDTLARHVAGRGARPAHEALSDRELDVLVRLAKGQSVKAIAADLSLSRKTVSTYHTRIRRKLHLQSDADLVRFALEQGLTA
jgi:two-component system invasion response regulator UvrY